MLVTRYYAVPAQPDNPRLADFDRKRRCASEGRAEKLAASMTPTGQIETVQGELNADGSLHVTVTGLNWPGNV